MHRPMFGGVVWLAVRRGVDHGDGHDGGAARAWSRGVDLRGLDGRRGRGVDRRRDGGRWRERDGDASPRRLVLAIGARTDATGPGEAPCPAQCATTMISSSSAPPPAAAIWRLRRGASNRRSWSSRRRSSSSATCRSSRGLAVVVVVVAVGSTSASSMIGGPLITVSAFASQAGGAGGCSAGNAPNVGSGRRRGPESAACGEPDATSRANAASSTSALALPFDDDLLHELLARLDVRPERLLHVLRDAVVLARRTPRLRSTSSMLDRELLRRRVAASPDRDRARASRSGRTRAARRR